MNLKAQPQEIQEYTPLQDEDEVPQQQPIKSGKFAKVSNFMTNQKNKIKGKITSQKNLNNQEQQQPAQQQQQNEQNSQNQNSHHASQTDLQRISLNPENQNQNLLFTSGEVHNQNIPPNIEEIVAIQEGGGKKNSKFQLAKGFFKDKMESGKVAAVTAFQNGKEKAHNRIKQTKAYNKYSAKRRQFQVYYKKKQESLILRAVSKIKPSIQKKIEDPFLYKPLKNMVNEVFEQNWSLFVEEVQFTFRMKNMEPYIDFDENQQLNCLQKLAAKFNYINMPNDKSLGKQLRDWKYIVFNFLQVIPYGVQQAYFIINFLCMDKKDEFQLINFIVCYKKMQWISQGVFMGIYGYIKFYQCVALAKKSEITNVYDICMNNAMGSNQNVHFQIICFLTNIILIWFCMFLLPFSKQKGQPRFRVVEDYEGQSTIEVIDPNEGKAKGCCSCLNWDRGGKLKGLMLFDLTIFIIATCIYIRTYFYLEFDDIEQSGEQLAFSKWLYGIFSFPFILFNISIFLNLLTRSKPTTYDVKGNCVPPKIEIVYPDPEEFFEQDEEELDRQLDDIEQENNIPQQQYIDSQQQNFLSSNPNNSSAR